MRGCCKQIVIMSDWYLYLVRCNNDGSLYTGITTNVARIIAQVINSFMVFLGTLLLVIGCIKERYINPLMVRQAHHERT